MAGDGITGMGWGRLPRAMLAACFALGLGAPRAQGVRPTRDADAAEQLQRARRAAAAGDGSGALRQAEALVAAHPEFAAGLKLDGMLLEESGRRVEAAAMYDRALKLTPRDGDLLLKVGVVRLLSGRTGEAVELLERLVRQAPADGDGLYYLAQAYHLKGDNDLALKTIQRCLKVDAANPAVWQKYGELLVSSGDNAGGVKWLEKARQADPTLARIDLDLAMASYKNQDLEDAERFAGRAVAARPNDLQATELLAAVEVKLSKWREAKPLFERVLAGKSDDPVSLLGLGHCELALKEYQAAAGTLERLLQEDPTQVLGHFYLSRTYAALGRTSEAEHEAELHSRMLEQAAALGPAGGEDAQKATTAKVRQLLTDGREGEALDVFRGSATGPYATPGEPYVLVGATYLYMGRMEDAERLLLKAEAMDPKVRGAHTYLGILALQEADLARAEGEFKAELEGEPNYQLAVAELGEVRYRQGRWEEAVEELGRSRTVAPPLLFMLCDAYFRLGKVKEANVTAELIVDYAKGDAGALKAVVGLLNRNGQAELAGRLGSR